jgi:hypothetical protein
MNHAHDLGTVVDLAIEDQLVSRRECAQARSHVRPGNTHSRHVGDALAMGMDFVIPAQCRRGTILGDIERDGFDIRFGFRP